MPQMSPLNWLSLFFIFSLTFIMFNLLNYFYLNLMKNNNLKTDKNTNMNYINWKW